MFNRVNVRKAKSKRFNYSGTQYFAYCPRCGEILNAGPNYQPRFCDKCGKFLKFTKADIILLSEKFVYDEDFLNRPFKR